MMDKIPFSVYDFFGYLASGFLVLIATDYSFAFNQLVAKDRSIEMSIFWIIVAYIIGHMIAHISSVVLEQNFLRKVLRSPELHLFSKTNSKWKFVFPGNFQPFPETTQERILSKARRMGLSEQGRALFLHCHPLVKKDQSTLDRLNTFLYLYGFCRNISMSLLLITVILILGMFISSDVHGTEYWGSPKLHWAIVTLTGSYIMFLRYLKFFRHYTVEVFITYAEMSE